MSKYTPEPWGETTAPRIEPGDERLRLGVLRQPPKVAMRILAEPNYQRAVLCVNACAGLNLAGIPEAVATLRELLNYVYQEGHSEWACNIELCKVESAVVYRRIRAAIAALEGRTS